MSIFDNYFDGSVALNLESDMSCSGAIGAYELATEALQEEHKIFKSMIRQDHAEICNRIDSNLVSESTLEAVQESAIGDIVKRVKEFIVKAGKKILGILQNIIDRIRLLCTQDGAKLVQKYEKQVRSNYNNMESDAFQVKWREYTGYKIPKANQSSVLSKLNSLKMQKDIYNSNDNKDASYEDKDFKPYTEDEKTNYKENLYGYICNSSKLDASDFKQELEEKFLKDEEDKDIKDININEVISVLKDYKKLTSNIEKDKKNTLDSIKEFQKVANDMEKQTNIELSKQGAKYKSKRLNITAGKLTSLCTIYTTCYSAAYAVELDVLKKRFKYAKAVFTKCATYRKKSAKNESAIDEFVSYETDVILGEI